MELRLPSQSVSGTIHVHANVAMLCMLHVVYATCCVCCVCYMLCMLCMLHVGLLYDVLTCMTDVIVHVDGCLPILLLLWYDPTF